MLHKLFLLFFSISLVLLSSRSFAQADDHYASVYGGPGAPLKYVVSSFRWDWHSIQKDGEKGAVLKAKLEKILQKTMTNIFQPELGIQIVQGDLSSIPDSDKSSAMILGIYLLTQQAKITNSKNKEIVGAVLPYFGRLGVALNYPYHMYAAPKLFLVPQSEEMFLKEFETALYSILEGEAFRLLCDNSKNKDALLCQKK